MELRFPALTPRFGLVAATLGFFAISVWWLTQDRRVPEFDPGLHTTFAFQFHDQISAGHLLGPFNDWNQYPPLIHLVGAIATFVAGKDIWPGVMAENLIFVPLLAVGCYGAARAAYGSELAGLLAAVFALGTPMIVSQFHEFMLDAPEAALVAASLWLLFASRGLERTSMAALAGVAIGLGLLTKESFPTFVAGAVVPVAVYAAWRRRWRGLLALVLVAAVVAAPWYIRHYDQVRALARITSAAGSSNAPGGTYPFRYSAKNAGWYFWAGVNYQNLVPLLSFAAVGAGLALWRLARRSWGRPLELALLLGGLVAWAGVTYSLPHDPRYSLPGLPYLAVLGAGWVALLPRRPRAVAATALCAVAFVNLIGVSFGIGKSLRVALPGAPTASWLGERQLTFYSNQGFTYGKPERSGDLLGLMRRLHSRGIHFVVWDFANANTGPFNNEGLSTLAESAGLYVANSPRKPPTDMVFLRHGPVPAGGRPCARLYDGTGVWVQLALAHPIDACPR